ncbi:hypothetical protein [Metabacillus bambusae]|nr:hypothetical protein [Metabacillus bambusae]
MGKLGYEFVLHIFQTEAWTDHYLDIPNIMLIKLINLFIEIKI